jgi:hypothetical protein
MKRPKILMITIVVGLGHIKTKGLGKFDHLSNSAIGDFRMVWIEIWMVLK